MDQSPSSQASVAIIAIGRNEGERLIACLKSLLSCGEHVTPSGIFYVDSGSTDGSAEAAEKLGVNVVRLDMSTPFTAARARNAGVAAVASAGLTPDYIQFLDGDCRLDAGWLAAAIGFLRAQEAVALVCGRRREIDPGASVYNRLCDIEWDTPVGEAQASGGDFLIKRVAFEAVGGFREDLIAGEEPEMCFRLRAAGFGIYRLEHEMTLHDAAMTSIGQWWRRMKRSGYAFANVSHLHRSSPERMWRRETTRAFFLGAGLPLGTAIAMSVIHPMAAAILAIYPLQMARIWMARSDLHKGRTAYAVSCVMGRFPECVGALNYWADRVQGRRGSLIEYKGAAGETSGEGLS